MRTFEVTHTINWIESEPHYVQANSYKEVSEALPNKNKRILNERFREIERTGKYYRITEQCKGGKAFIYETI